MSVQSFEGGERFLPVRAVAARLGLTPDAVYKKVRRGEFPAGFKFGAARRWKLSELETWESEHRMRA